MLIVLENLTDNVTVNNEMLNKMLQEDVDELKKTDELFIKNLEKRAKLVYAKVGKGKSEKSEKNKDNTKK